MLIRRLGRRLAGIWRWAVSRRPRRPRIHHPSVTRRLLTWARKIRSCSGRRRRLGGVGGDYYRIRHEFEEEEEEEAKPPPEGQMAVYVGGPPRRYLVPVIFFNHPLFAELLKEAEAEFGFRHPGGITIPCPVSQFERVRTRIASSVDC